MLAPRHCQIFFELTRLLERTIQPTSTAKFAQGHDSLPVLLLEPEIDALIGDAIQRTSAGAYLALEPRLAEDILAAVRTQISSPGARGS